MLVELFSPNCRVTLLKNSKGSELFILEFDHVPTAGNHIG